MQQAKKKLTRKQQERDFAQKIPSRFENHVSEESKGLRREKQHASVLLVADGRKKRKDENCVQGHCRSEPFEIFFKSGARKVSKFVPGSDAHQVA